MSLDKFFARGDFGAHEGFKQRVGFGGVFNRHALQEASGRIHRGFPKLIRIHFSQTFVALDGDFSSANDNRLDFLFSRARFFFEHLVFCLCHDLLLLRGLRLHLSELLQNLLLPLIRISIAHLLAEPDAIERRLGEIDVSVVNQIGEVAEEQSEKESGNVCAVHVSIRHDDDAVIAEFFQVEHLADVSAKRNDEIFHFIVVEDFIKACALHVQNLPSQGKDGLKVAVASLLGASSGRVSLDDVEFALVRIAVGTIGELARERHALERALAQDRVARGACGAAGFCGDEAF